MQLHISTQETLPDRVSYAKWFKGLEKNKWTITWENLGSYGELWIFTRSCLLSILDVLKNSILFLVVHNLTHSQILFWKGVCTLQVLPCFCSVSGGTPRLGRDCSDNRWSCSAGELSGVQDKVGRNSNIAQKEFAEVVQAGRLLRRCREQMYSQVFRGGRQIDSPKDLELDVWSLLHLRMSLEITGWARPRDKNKTK